MNRSLADCGAWYEAILFFTSGRVRTPFFGPDEALLEEVISADSSDVELNRIRESLNVVSFEDPLLGVLTLEQSVNAYFGLVNWNGRDVSVTLSLSKDAPAAGVQKAQAAAHLLWQNQHDWDQRIRALAVKTLLPEKNAELDEDEAPLTATQFKKRMQIYSIEVRADGSFEICYDDGDMFGGNGIFVGGSLSAGPTEAYLGGE
jgi:hypothetical protein